jgi:hypothetical protein
MRFAIFGAALVVLAGAGPALSRAGDVVTADYVEARTASVFAGACHFNGEVVTTGREAVLAWSVRSGSWAGTDLAGARAVAVVNSEQTLADAKASRRSELVVDAASDAQAAALVEALRAESGAALGEVVRVRRAPIAFERTEKSYRVDAPGFAALSVQAMPNAECCKMPNLVWYKPLVSLADRKVGYTERAFYAGGDAGVNWERAGENGAFYGLATLDGQ